MKIYTSGTGSKENGLHFTDCVFYGQAVQAVGTGTSTFNDLFFTLYANDGMNSETDFYTYYFDSAAPSSIVMFSNSWTNAQRNGI